MRGFPFFPPLNVILVDLARPRPSGASAGEFFFPGAAKYNLYMEMSPPEAGIVVFPMDRGWCKTFLSGRGKFPVPVLPKKLEI